MNLRRSLSSAALLALAAAFPLAAQSAPAPHLRLPHMLSDHAVLQRDRPIHIWGWDAPGAAITVDFRHQHITTQADQLGAFSAWLNPESPGGPDTLTVHGSDTVTLHDILVGDVWFASGQSNMQIPLNGFPGSAVIKDASREIASANDPAVCGQIHLLVVPLKSNDSPLDDQTASWTPCNSTTAADFSAVAFFFGRELHAREHVPIGLIDSTWGGTPISSWISLSALASNTNLMPVFAARARFADLQPHLAAQLAYQDRTIAAAQAAHQPVPGYPWINPDEAAWEPSFLFNAMIAPATPYTIRGFLWYQGEEDSNPNFFIPQLYNRLLPALIQDWRARWDEGNLPFLFVQISSYYSPNEDWGLIRDAQRQTLSVANTAMAVSLDVGLHDNVHPPDKQTVAARLAVGARVLAYGERGANGEPLEDSGPLPRTVTSTPGALRVWFSHAEGLHATGDTIRGFELAGPDGHFHPADATLDGDSVLVHSAAVPHPTAVRYAWASFTDANLYNSTNLPASTFQWPQPTNP